MLNKLLYGHVKKLRTTTVVALLAVAGYMTLALTNVLPASGLIVSAAGDTTPPSVPAGLVKTGSTPSSVSLQWNASTDNVGVAKYNVYIGGTLDGSTTTTTYTVGKLTPSSSYSVSVAAVDAAGNTSARSSAINATTLGFVHPGILLDSAQLNFVKGKIAASTAPWKAAYDAARQHPMAASTYTPMPRAVVDCGFNNVPNNGCTDELNDASAAYLNAILWSYTGNTAYAQKSIQIMNAWSAVLTNHTNNNAKLQAAWVAEFFPRAAEIIRYSNAGWASADVTRFSNMLNTAFLPLIVNGDAAANGNWELSMADGAMNIAVFNNDPTTYDKAVSLWRGRVPAYVYNTSDGAFPKPTPGGTYSTRPQLDCFWSNNKAGCATNLLTYQNGQGQETCRDLHHLAMGYAALINQAETARIQGLDLYGEQQTRLVAGLEQNAKYINGAVAPPSLCYGSALVDRTIHETYEVAFNHYGIRKSQAMPSLEQAIIANRPAGRDQDSAWETLTHAAR